MISETRKTAQGTEYWDNEEKKVLFVPAGKEPNFEVTVNPESMLIGVDLATGKDMTVITHALESMNVKQLHTYAAELNIEIPPEIKSKKDIISFLLGEDEDDGE